MQKGPSLSYISIFTQSLAKLPRGLKLLLRHVKDDERKQHKMLKQLLGTHARKMNSESVFSVHKLVK